MPAKPSTIMRDAIAKRDVCELTDDEIDAISGGTLEISIGPLTLQVNADSGCFAVWWGKEFVGGACKK